MKKIIGFIRECSLEMRKVSWPTRDEVAVSTRVVVISVLIISFILGVVDYFFFLGVNAIL